MKTPRNSYPTYFHGYSDFPIIEIMKKNRGINVLILAMAKKPHKLISTIGYYFSNGMHLKTSFKIPKLYTWNCNGKHCGMLISANSVGEILHSLSVIFDLPTHSG